MRDTLFSILELINPRAATALQERAEQTRESFALSLSKANNFQSTVFHCFYNGMELIEWLTGVKIDILEQLDLKDLLTKVEDGGFQYTKKVNINTTDISVEIEDVRNKYNLDSIHNKVPGIEYKAGYILRADADNRFGGWSGMAFDNDNKLILVSDLGAFLETTPKFDQQGTLEGFFGSKIGLVRDTNGEVLSKKNQDIEEIAFYQTDVATGFLLSHEGRDHKIAFLSGENEGGVHVTSWASLPYGIKNLPKNSGLEAISVSPMTNQVFAISEKSIIKGGNFHLMKIWQDINFNADETLNYYYQSSPGYDVSGMTFLNNGDMLVLERMCSPYTFGLAEVYNIKVKLVDADQLIRPSHYNCVWGDSLLSIDNEYTYHYYPLADNFESIAVKEFDDGNTSIFLLSDDNRAPLQRTLILQFDMDQEVLSSDAHSG